MDKQDVDLKISAWKGFKAFLCFAIPALVNHFLQLYPDIYNLGIGAGIVAIWNAVKIKWFS